MRGWARTRAAIGSDRPVVPPSWIKVSRDHLRLHPPAYCLHQVSRMPCPLVASGMPLGARPNVGACSEASRSGAVVVGCEREHETVSAS